MSAARFELVRTDAGWHARFIAANNRIVWTTETYTRRRAAERAIDTIAYPGGGPFHRVGVDERVSS